MDMTRTSTTASPAQVWGALIDIDSWPRWTKSMTSVERLDDGPLRVGSRARLAQPKMRPLIWQVTELTEKSGFTWQTYNLGVTTTGIHRLIADGTGTIIELGVQHAGALAWLIRLLSKPTDGYPELEAAGLKAAAEAAATDGADRQS
ncbi:MAG: SRPBCC family protein [Actinomycetota bacterium]|nr:SRPBCC family protein [Actinomycetota bacterium]